MLRDITLGQYYPVDSVLHRLDPRTKLFGTLVYIISLFAAGGAAAYGLAAVFLAAAIRLSRVPVKFIVRGLKSILILLLISVSFNLFLTPGTPIFQIGFLKMTWSLNREVYAILFSDLSDGCREEVARKLYGESDSIIRKQLEEISSCKELSEFLSLYGSLCQREEVQKKLHLSL